MHYIENVKELKNRKSKIIFANGDSLTLNVSFHSLWHQYTNAIIYYYMVDKQSRMKSNNPEQPIDYNQSSLNIFEALSRYSLLKKISFFPKLLILKLMTVFQFKICGTLILNKCKCSVYF